MLTAKHEARSRTTEVPARQLCPKMCIGRLLAGFLLWIPLAFVAPPNTARWEQEFRKARHTTDFCTSTHYASGHASRDRTHFPAVCGERSTSNILGHVKAEFNAQGRAQNTSKYMWHCHLKDRLELFGCDAAMLIFLDKVHMPG